MGKTPSELTMSLDDYVTRPGVNADAPLGAGSEGLHE
jgi:hypothetical protein